VTWLLLIYTVPSHPSRSRATVWRELKKIGAVYLRDGVAVLPDQAELRPAFRAIAEKITEFGGQTTLVEGAQLDPAREVVIIGQANANREEEYAEVVRETEAFLAHVRRERAHRELTFPELDEIEADLGKLTRWVEQIRSRDHFAAPSAHRMDALVAQGEAALAAFLEETYAQRGEEGV